MLGISPIAEGESSGDEKRYCNVDFVDGFDGN